MTESRLTGPVRIVGVGLLGASIGLGLRTKGIDVILADASPTHLAIAADYGAGRPAQPGDRPQLIVVCVPPDVTADVVAAELEAYPEAIVTDVASVKLAVYEDLKARGADLSRYIGTHPLAGRERGGPMSGRADLFVGRPWVVAAHGGMSYQDGSAIDDLILDLGATLVELTPEQHDRAVALVSHVPQVVSSLLARRLIDALEQLDALGARRRIAEELFGGNTGVERLPGKHGVDRRYASLIVMVDDRPGQLARLFNDVGDAGVNLEDLRLEHSPGAQVGLAEIFVLPEVQERLTDELAARGWRIAG